MREDNKEIQEPTRKEVKGILRNMKNNKSPGQNGIAIENIKYGGEQLRQKIYELITDIWKKEKMPDEWGKASIIPILKSGDKTNCNNYWGIFLLDVVYKILATAIRTKLEAMVEPWMGEYQAGFRKGRGTTDQLFIMKEVWTTCYEYNIPAVVLFVDFKKAYDSVKRSKVIEAMKEFEIPAKLQRLVIMTLKRTTCNVKTKGGKSEDFMVKTGLRQGDPLSTLLFNMVLEKTVRSTEINRDGDMLYKSHQIVGYADDLAVIARA